MIDILRLCIFAVGSDMHVGDRCAELIGDEHAGVGYNGSGHVGNGHEHVISDKYVGWVCIIEF